jgi:hypothetical protein
MGNFARVLYMSTFLSRGGQKFSARIDQHFSRQITAYKNPYKCIGVVVRWMALMNNGCAIQVYDEI